MKLRSKEWSGRMYLFMTCVCLNLPFCNNSQFHFCDRIQTLPNHSAVTTPKAKIKMCELQNEENEKMYLTFCTNTCEGGLLVGPLALFAVR